MINEVNGQNGHDGKILHPDRNLMVGYVTGLCSADVKKIIEEHCIDCRDCRTQLSILLYLNICSLMDENEQRWFADILLLGEEAAARARSIVMEQQERQLNHLGNHSAAGLGKRLGMPRLGLLAPALTIIVMIVSGLVGYLALSRQSSDEGTLARVRDIYQDTRSLQARVTGGFAHREYVETRNPGDPIGVDESRRIALLSELDHEVFTDQRAASRHNLGRLFMLHCDLGPAEQQFLLALKEHPRDARILTDLGALYYERSRKEIKEDIVLLHKAAEHLSNAVETDPRLPEAWFNRALCYERMNLFLQAESDWKRYLTLDGDSAWAEEAREHLNELHERATRLEK